MYAHLALGQLRLDGRPCLGLSSIREQVHDDSTLANGLVHLEQVCSRDPAILHCFLPRRAILSYTDNDIETIVAEIETLTVTLRAITDQSESVILKIFLSNLSIMLSCGEEVVCVGAYQELLSRPVFSLKHLLLVSSEVNSLNASRLLYRTCKSSPDRGNSCRSACKGRAKCALLKWLGGQLLP